MPAEDGRRLLIAAGIPEDIIDADALLIATTIADGLAEAFAKQVVTELLPLVLYTAACRERWRQLGITFED